MPRDVRRVHPETRRAASGRAGHVGGGLGHGQSDAREEGRGRARQGAQTQGEAQNQGQTEEGAQEGARRARARRSRGEGGRGRSQRRRGGRQRVRDVPNAHVAARSRFSSLRRRLKGSIGKLRDDGESWYNAPRVFRYCYALAR